MDEFVGEYIVATIVLVQCEHETLPIEQRFRIISLSIEPGRKFAYGSVPYVFERFVFQTVVLFGAFSSLSRWSRGT